MVYYQKHQSTQAYREGAKVRQNWKYNALQNSILGVKYNMIAPKKCKKKHPKVQFFSNFLLIILQRRVSIVSTEVLLYFIYYASLNQLLAISAIWVSQLVVRVQECFKGAISPAADCGFLLLSSTQLHIHPRLLPGNLKENLKCAHHI